MPVVTAKEAACCRNPCLSPLTRVTRLAKTGKAMRVASPASSTGLPARVVVGPHNAQAAAIAKIVAWIDLETLFNDKIYSSIF